MNRAAYHNKIESFVESDPNAVLGRLVEASSFSVEITQRGAWAHQIQQLQDQLKNYRGRGSVYFEWAIPRLGKRIDVVLIVDHVIFVMEYKVGESKYTANAIDQVCDYALDLKNFHESSHDLYIAPILIATNAINQHAVVSISVDQDHLLQPIYASSQEVPKIIASVLTFVDAPSIDTVSWERGRYCPTPTIIEAATALYRGHAVKDISRSDAGARNLTQTTGAVEKIIRESRSNSQKSVCFVTGVPGAGKTLVGLNIATQHLDQTSDLYSVFLSGNGPLVSILRESLARDKVNRRSELGQSLRIGVARSEVKAIIQNVHHFRDDCLADPTQPPIEHVALFDEAQRAWNLDQTAKFMKRKKNRPAFDQSEPEFLISCLDRHKDWAVVICLVGGGQEINTGEAGIMEWIDAVCRSFPHWQMHLSSRLTDIEFGAGQCIEKVRGLPNTYLCDDLHLGVSMRSYRAENVSKLVKQILDLNPAAADTLTSLVDQYPVVLTRSLEKAKAWLRQYARGSERYGMVVSSQAQRLKPHAIDVRSPIDPIHWFLDDKEDVRSSYYLEDVATEFHVQGLELDWACIIWDADFRYKNGAWEHWSFVGSRWNHIRKKERQIYLKNAYRVLLTRARQGMVIVVPEGDPIDPTRRPDYYDDTFSYLSSIGFQHLS